MRWEVTGAEKESGKDVVLVVDAATEQLAVDVAVGRGVMVEKAIALPGWDAMPTTPPQTGSPYKSPYEGLRAAAGWVRTAAGMLCVLGIIGLVAFVLGILSAIMVNNGVSKWSEAASINAAVSGFTAALILLPAFALLYLASEAGLALRDIAERGK